jgi:enamine deaminase RidA (YjgF/YER057c/UK114 family)
MPAFGDVLDDMQIANVVNYIRTHFGNSYTDEPATPDAVALARPKKETPMKPPVAAKKVCRFSFLTLCLMSGGAHAADKSAIVRTPMANPAAPIAAAVTVPPGYATYYISGALADPADPKAPEGSPQRWGNTEAQTASILGKMKTSLAALGLSFADVVQAHVYLAADPATGKLDFAGLNKAWSVEFGTATQPNKPARAAVQVAALVAPGALVEIEFIAAKKAK